jgi:23S rRNA-/tRNA-specific pseudouridylate synthase
MVTFIELKRQFGAREMTKKYLAIVHGVPVPADGVIEKPLARSSDYRKQVVAGSKTKTKIRPAITKYRVTEGFGGKYALVEAMPKTGRMHQIRVHLTSIGHPIVGDKKYGLKSIKPDPSVERQLLHAQSLEFSLYGYNYAFSAELPEDFRLFIESQK